MYIRPKEFIKFFKLGEMGQNTQNTASQASSKAQISKETLSINYPLCTKGRTFDMLYPSP